MNTGHCTLESIKLNKWRYAPVNFQDFDTPDKEFAHMIADNELAKLAKMNLSKVNKLILDYGPFDIKLLGMPSFAIEPMDRINLDEIRDGEYEEEKEKEKKNECPKCGFKY